jgi:hypothetical protein
MKPTAEAKAGASNYALIGKGLAVMVGIPAGISTCCSVPQIFFTVCDL